MENKLVHFSLPVDPETGIVSETDMFSYRGVFLHWGIRSELVPDLGLVVTNTVAIVEHTKCNKDGNYDVILLAPEEVSFG